MTAVTAGRACLLREVHKQKESQVSLGFKVEHVMATELLALALAASSTTTSIFNTMLSTRQIYLLLHVANDAIGLSGATIICWLSLSEDLEGTVTAEDYIS